MFLPAIVLFFALSGAMLIAAQRKYLQSERNRLKIIRANDIRMHLKRGHNRWSRQ